jgi:hypothetical protein
MIHDPGKVMDRHQHLQTESNPGRYTPQRNCTGCRKRKSIMQFDGASTSCRQCVRRTPKPHQGDMMDNAISPAGQPSAFTDEDRLSALIVERDAEIIRLKGVIEHLQGVIGGLHMEAAQRYALTTKPAADLHAAILALPFDASCIVDAAARGAYEAGCATTRDAAAALVAAALAASPQPAPGPILTDAQCSEIRERSAINADLWAESHDDEPTQAEVDAVFVRGILRAALAAVPGKGEPVVPVIDKENVVQQARQWAQEARMQRSTVIGILKALGLPERDWEAQSLVLAHVASIKSAAPASVPHLSDIEHPMQHAYPDEPQPAVSPQQAAPDESFYRRVVYGNGWNACRDAMLTVAQPTAQGAMLKEAAKLAPILRSLCEGGGEEFNVDIYAPAYQAGDGDVFVTRAADLLERLANPAEQSADKPAPVSGATSDVATAFNELKDLLSGIMKYDNKTTTYSIPAAEFIDAINVIQERAVPASAVVALPRFDAEKFAGMLDRLSIANRRDGWTTNDPWKDRAASDRAKKAVEQAERELTEYVQSLLATAPAPQAPDLDLISRIVDRDTPPDSRNDVIDHDINGKPITRADVAAFARAPDQTTGEKK